MVIGVLLELRAQALNKTARDFDYWPLSPIPEKVTVTYNVLDDGEVVEGEVFEETYFIKPQPIPRFAYRENL